MAKRTIATNWNEVVPRDETGAIVAIEYICPYCHYPAGEMIIIGAGNVDKIDRGFETDQVCGICGKDVIIGCL